MTKWSTMAKGLDPSEPCLVCFEARENHGDKNHQFSVDGQLIPLKKGDPPRQQPPRRRDESSTPMGEAASEVAKDATAQMTLRLIEVLTKKGLLTGEDLFIIFGGQNDSSN